MFALEWCEFCWSVRKLFAQLGIAYRSVDLDSVAYQAARPAAAKIRAVLKARTGTPTIPQIFIGGEHVGGCTDLFDAMAQRRACSSCSTQRGVELRRGASISIRTRCCRSGCIRARPPEREKRHDARRFRSSTSASLTARRRARAIDRGLPRLGLLPGRRPRHRRRRVIDGSRGARLFFAQPPRTSARILRDADNPWGYFDQELTKNRQDWKEIYDFGPPTAARAAALAGRACRHVRAGAARYYAECDGAVAASCWRRSRRISACRPGARTRLRPRTHELPAPELLPAVPAPAAAGDASAARVGVGGTTPMPAR